MATVSSRHPGGRPRTYELSKFGERLDARLSKRGWSRNDLSHATGINASTLWRWMVGLASPPLDRILVIAGKLGCEPADLLPKKGR